MSDSSIVPIPSPEATFTELDRRMLHEIHAAITTISNVIQTLPLDKLAKSPVLRVFGI